MCSRRLDIRGIHDIHIRIRILIAVFYVFVSLSNQPSLNSVQFSAHRWGSINGLTINIDTVTMICWDPTPNVAPLVQRVLQEDSATKITCPLSELQEQRLKKLLKLNFGSSMDCNRTPRYIV
jgi:hypothetical protein